jgi:hypothetical protein
MKVANYNYLIQISNADEFGLLLEDFDGFIACSSDSSGF